MGAKIVAIIWKHLLKFLPIRNKVVHRDTKEEQQSIFKQNYYSKSRKSKRNDFQYLPKDTDCDSESNDNSTNSSLDQTCIQRLTVAQYKKKQKINGNTRNITRGEGRYLNNQSYRPRDVESGLHIHPYGIGMRNIRKQIWSSFKHL